MKTSKYYDSAAVVQLIGCCMLNPELLDGDKYVCNEEDFTTAFHKVVFGSIQNLHTLGTTNITCKEIENYLTNRPESAAEYKKGRGSEWVIEAMNNADLANFDYYYQKVKKMTLLRAYEDCGLDVSFIYNPDELSSKNRKAQEDFLDDTPIEQIADIIDNKITQIREKVLDRTMNEAIPAGLNIDELITNLGNEPDFGAPMYGRFVNTITRGARLGKFYCRSAASGVGKAIPNDVTIPTPDGQRKVGDIKPGDMLFGQDGKPTKVLAIHPQQEKKDIYKIVFSDDREALCCEDHLWTYMYYGHSEWKYRTESLKDIIKRSKGKYQKSDNVYKYRVPLCQPVEYEKKQYSIDPYIFGLMIGDGSFRYSEGQKGFSLSSADEELPSAIANYLGVYYKKSSKYNYNYTFGNEGYNVWVEDILSDYPELWNVKSENKFIPREYLEGSVEQRFELLRGLLDTDGFIDKKGRTGFTSISKKLIDNVVELCRSLGFITSIVEDNRKEKYTTTGICYTVNIQCKKEIKPLLFKLSRKLEKAKEYAESKKRAEHKNYIAIKNIIKMEEKTDMTCFTVDNDSHLFLMNDFIVTHNTRTMIADVCTIGCSCILENGEWKDTGDPQPVLYISTELELDEVQTMMLSFLSGVNEDKILNNNYDFGEFDTIKKAADILKESPIYIECIPDFSSRDIENTIKRNIRVNHCRYIFFDYLHTSTKLLTEIGRATKGVNIREDNVLFLLSTKLKDISVQYDVFILTSTQLNQGWKTDDYPDQNLLRGAKSIADRLDLGTILLDVTPEDEEKIQDIVQEIGCPMPNVKMSIYKNRRGKYNKMFLWMYADKGTCRFNGLFATNFKHEIINLSNATVPVICG